MKVVFFGTPDFAVASLSSLIAYHYDVVAVVTTPDKEMGRGKKIQESAVKTFARNNNLLVLQPNNLKSKTFLEKLKSLGADIHVVVAFRMLPKVVWNMPPLGTINVHGSMLPAYRGAAPINWAIINGETYTGVTTFRLKHEIDTGDILLQEKIPILEEDNFGTLYDKMKLIGAALLVKTLALLDQNALTPIAQMYNGEFKSAPKLAKDTGLIDWQANVIDIHNLIRGLSPMPGAYTFIHGKKLKIFRSRYEITANDGDIGSHHTDGKTYLYFITNDGRLYVDDLQIEGKKRLLIADFLRGFRP